jgi:DNA-binding PadR family transcriptional regulator
MTETEALMLHVVQRQGRVHGLAVARAIEETTGKMLSVGSLYKALHRLTRDGFLSAESEKPGKDEPHQGPPRRYYSITSAGARALEGFRTERARIGRVLNLKKGFAR